MSSLISLIKVNTLGIFRNKNSKRKFASLLVLVVYALVAYYSYQIAEGLIYAFGKINAEDLVIKLFYTILSLYLILANFKKVNSLFFKDKMHDILFSMPIKKKSIIISKIIEIYFSSLLVMLAALIPLFIVYLNAVSVDVLFIINYILLIFLLPIIPVIISVIIGYLISYISSFFRKKDLVQGLLSAAFIIALPLLSSTIKNNDYTMFINFNEKFSELLNGIYPLNMIYSKILFDGSYLYLLIYIAIIFVTLYATIHIISKLYVSTYSKLQSGRKSKTKKIKEGNSHSKIMALTIKNYKKLFSTSSYWLNTCISVLIFVFMVIFFITTNDTNNIEIVTSNTTTLNTIFTNIFIITLVMPAAVSLSLEGNKFYILKVLPISYKEIFLSKVLFELIITIPLSILISIYLLASKAIIASQIINVLIIYILNSILFSIIHTLLDIFFIKLDWTNEIKIIKRGVSVIISVILSFLSTWLPIRFIDDFGLIIYVYMIILILLILISLFISNKWAKRKYSKLNI